MERLRPARRPGGLTGDGRADLVARDKAGVLWLYRGTGNASAPFAKPVKARGNFASYRLMF